MTDREKISQLENEIAVMKRQIDFINKRFKLAPNQDELSAAINDIITSRDTKALAEYLERGGRIG
jgi:hypothetical protein